jgi:hypothetical protein
MKKKKRIDIDEAMKKKFEDEFAEFAEFAECANENKGAGANAKKYVRIQSSDELCFEACVNLAAAVLIDAHDTYIRALRDIKKNIAWYKEFRAELALYDTYCAYKNEYKRVLGIAVAKRELEDKRTIANYRKFKQRHKDIVKLVEETGAEHKAFMKKVNKAYDFNELIREKSNIESFYNSPLFKVYTMGSELKGKELIEKFKKEANWTDVDENNVKTV